MQYLVSSVQVPMPCRRPSCRPFTRRHSAREDDDMRLETGAHVTGTYMGSRFTGAIRSHRQHSINYKVTEVFVGLDAPVHIDIIDRTEENTLILHVAFDGSALNGSAGNWGDTNDYLESADCPGCKFHPSVARMFFLPACACECHKVEGES